MSQENQVQKVGFGYVDDTDESLKTKASGTFGLNQGFVTKFEYNPNAGADGAAANAIDIHVMVKDREYRTRIYEVNKVYNKDGEEIPETDVKEWTEAYNAKWKQENAVIVHFLKVFRTDEEVKQAFSAPINDFKTFAEVAQSLMPDGFQSVPVDIFLEYQWNISDGQNRTFLQVPRNMKGGYFVVPAQTGTWKEEIIEGALVYKNESGQEHPFTRDKSYMESNKAIQQIEGEEPQPGIGGGPTPPSGGQQATSGTW